MTSSGWELKQVGAIFTCHSLWTTGVCRFICPTKRTTKANTTQIGKATIGRSRFQESMSRLRAVLAVNLPLLKNATPGDVQVVACRHGAESHRRHILLFRAILLHRIGDGRGPGRD